MARRRSGGSAGWSVKTSRGPLWKYVHPVKYLRGQARTAVRQMRPDRAIGRAMSIPEVRAGLRTQTKKATAQTRQPDVTRAAKKASAAKRAAAKRADPYAAALAIPGQNRQIAARQAKAAQPAKKTTAVRKTDGSGRFDGREAMAPRELERFEQAERRYVDPQLLPRSARTRRR
jgi:hypothetical protein